MTPGEIVNLVFIAFVSAGMTSLMLRQISDLRQEMAEFRAEVRDEFRAVRAEIHSDIASVRADLTQVALAVGANRPQASGS